MKQKDDVYKFAEISTTLAESILKEGKPIKVFRLYRDRTQTVIQSIEAYYAFHQEPYCMFGIEI